MLTVTLIASLAIRSVVTVNSRVAMPVSPSISATSSTLSDATSSFKIVPMPRVSAIVTIVPSICALERSTEKVSSNSTKASPATSTVTVVDKSPAVIVAVCETIAV